MLLYMTCIHYSCYIHLSGLKHVHMRLLQCRIELNQKKSKKQYGPLSITDTLTQASKHFICCFSYRLY